MRAPWVAVALVLAAGTAHAEESVNPFEDAADPTPFGIRVAIRGATATISVSFRLAVEAKVVRNVTLWRPSHAVVTAGTVRDSSGRHPLTLVREEEASAAFEALLNAPAASTRGAMAQLSESSPLFDPDLAVIAPTSTTLTFELQYEAPTCLHAEQRYVLLPDAWESHLPAALKARVVRDGEDVPDCGDRKPSTYLRYAAPYKKPIAATAGRFSNGTKQAARVEIATAKKLSEIPADLHTVFVIDASRSMSSEQRKSARAVVRSYLAHASRSSVQVVTFARTASALLTKWSPASTAKAIDTALSSTVPKNGSEVQSGLREAGRWLARAKGTRRVVFISDERVASRVEALSTETLAKELPEGTLVHVVGVSDSGGVWRDDDARWVALAAKTEGIGAQAGIDEKGNLDALELVRPIAVDHTKVASAGWEHLEGGCTDVRLAEGTTCTWWGASDKGDAITVEGLVWNKRWSQTLPLGDAANIVIARQLRFVANVDEELADAALDASQSLSTKWSLLARWGGEGGYADQPGGGGTGWGTTCGDCRAGTIGHGSGTGYAVPEIHPLKLQLYDAVHWCMRDDVTVALTVETTIDEIVDVAATVTLKNGKGAPTDAAQIESCVIEGVWATNVQFSMPRSRKVHKLVY